MTTRISQCLVCKHFSGQVEGSDEQGCEAFPSGIPDDVWKNKVMHTEPIEGDNGIVFERRVPLSDQRNEEF